MMKTYMKCTAYVAVIVSLLLCTSCTDFEELNTNPTKSTIVNPNSQLAYVQLWTYGDAMVWETGGEYPSAFVQQMQGNWGVTNFGGQYRKSNNHFANFWTRMYEKNIKNLVDILNNTDEVAQYQNVRAAARVFKVYNMMIITDLYGDIPYFEAGKGYSDGIVKPRYDEQELIYKDFLNELKLAEAAFNTDGGSLTGDVIYNGDLQKWRRFANSLRLRAAMRIVKAEPELARTEVADILASPAGLLASANDDAIISYNNINDWDYEEFRRNGLSQVRRGREAYPAPFICATFWNRMKNTNDPRLFRIGRAYHDQLSPNDPFNRVDITDEILEVANIDLFQPVLPGFFVWDNWPNGYWSDSLNDYLMTQTRPQLNNAFLRGDAPGILISYAEVQLLLSEAKARWGANIPGGMTAADYYRSGVRASMNLLSDNYDIDAISNDEFDDYMHANPYPSGLEAELEAINTQLWIHHINNHFEAYANWRRSGYPLLTPASAHGALTIDSQTIPRRLNYPLFEEAYNKEAFDAALARMGGSDDWNSNVWWDRN